MTEELVNIKSDSPQTNEKIIEYITQLFRGFDIKEIPQKKGNLYVRNLIIKVKSVLGSSKTPILFAMHLDTVPGQWFSKAELDDTRLIGLGASDMKGGIASVCSAVLSHDFDRDVYLLFSADEETSGNGSKLIRRQLGLKKAITILPEPTSRKAYNAQNSCISYEVTTKGGMQHASIDPEFNEKNNAIFKMIGICNMLSKYKNKDNNLVNQNIGFISGGNTANIVPGECTMKFEQRFRPGTPLKNKLHYVKKELIANGAKNIKLRFIGKDFKNKSEDNNKFKRIVSDFFPLEFATYKAWSEASIFSDMGPCFIFGPGILEQAHRKKEYINIKDLISFEKIYVELINKL